MEETSLKSELQTLNTELTEAEAALQKQVRVLLCCNFGFSGVPHL